MNYHFDGQRWHTQTIGGHLSADSHEGLVVLFEGERAKASKFLGRPATDREVENGVAKPALTQEERRAARQAESRRQYAARLAAEADYSPEAARLAAAQSRAEEERRATLTASQRELEDAQSAASAAEARKADEAKAAEIRQSKPYLSLRNSLDELLLAARLDPSVSTAELQALESQSEGLEQKLDIQTTRGNVTQLQQVISGRLDLEAAGLRQATDMLEARRKMLASGQVWDDVDTELVGDMAFVVLTVNGKTVKVSQQAYDSRESDESLRDSLFGEVAHV